MAAKEKKSSITKHLTKDNQPDRSNDSITLRGGRKVPSATSSNDKSASEVKSPAAASAAVAAAAAAKKKKKPDIPQDGRTTPNTRKRRSVIEGEQDERESAKTPPPSSAQFKPKKSFLEKELEDILENATGRNTPATPRTTRKLNEKDEDGGDTERMARTRKGGSADAADADDDNVSVRSFTTLLRTRKAPDKDVDDDAASVASVSVKTKKNDMTLVNSDESAPAASGPPRSGLIKKVVRKKEKVSVVKKAAYLKRGRPKKNPKEGKSKSSIKKKKKSKKAVEEIAAKDKRGLGKGLKGQGASRVVSKSVARSAMLLRRQRAKTGNDPAGGSKPTAKPIKVTSEPEQTDAAEQTKSGVKSESTEDDNDVDVLSVDEPKNDGKAASKRKLLRKDTIRKSERNFRYPGERGESDATYYPEDDAKPKMNLAKKLSSPSKKRKKVPGIHYETTSSPDDSSVMIVQPRLGPRLKYARLKHMVVRKPLRNIRPKGVVPKIMLPPTPVSTSPVTHFNPMGNPYFVQQIPNFKLLATNSNILRTFGTNAAINPNFDSKSPISPKNLPFVEGGGSDGALTTFTRSPNDNIIVTPRRIVLSSSRVVSSGSQPGVCVNGPSTSGTVSFAAQKSIVYQNASIQPQTCTKTTTAIVLEGPHSVSASFISTATGTVVINSNVELKVNKPEPEAGKIVEAKSEEGDDTASSSSPASNNPKNRKQTSDKTDDEKDMPNALRDMDPSVKRKELNHSPKRSKRMLRNVRHSHSSISEVTFSEPEISNCGDERTSAIFKTISCERLDKSASVRDEPASKVVLQLGSAPIAISESLEPFETASGLLADKSGKLDKKLKISKDSAKEESTPVKEAVAVCSFSKENAEALKELGLDSDVDQNKSEMEVDSSPINNDDDPDLTSKKEKMKEEVDNVLKEMPNRKMPNILRKSTCFNFNKKKMDVKNPLVLKNNDYLTKSPSKPPTVIDKLLERNKSLKKAEEESKYQNSILNLSENLIDVKPKKSLREIRTKKFAHAEHRRLVANKTYINTNSGCKVYERRGSNPELYSNNYLSGDGQVANENVPLRRTLDVCDTRRRGSIDYESMQKVMERRSSLPTPGSENASDLDAKKIKTENIKTILIGSSAPPAASKPPGSEQQTARVINIITEDDGSKKGQNLRAEIGIEIGKGSEIYMNGEAEAERRTSIDSSNSESGSLKKLMSNVTVSKRDGKTPKQVPYVEGKGSALTVEKVPLEEKSNGKAVIEESPEDIVTKETILSALGLQRASSLGAQKRDGSSSSSQCENGGNYTGTLKTVIKIQRQEKKGNSKAPMKMIYKASSSSSSVSGANEDHGLEQDWDSTSKEEPEEEIKNGNGKTLVIPEKASSFSIHPGRLCSDVCTYCFGKFGLLDTPCHIAQLKDAHKRRNILDTETHLLADSCLCDACFRHVDKKSNCPTFTEKKIDKRKCPTRKQTCCARNCNSNSEHNVRRKWFTKLKKSIGRKIILDEAKLEKIQPSQFVTLCHRHFYWIDYFMTCGICKKRLTSVNMYKIGSDVIADLNAAISADGIPTILTEKRFLCKICHCYASMRIKSKDPNDMSHSQFQFYETYRKRILQCHEIEVPDSDAEQDRDSKSSQKKDGKKPRRSARVTATVTNENSKSDVEVDGSPEETETKKPNSKMKEVSHMNIPPKANGNLDFGGVSITPATTEVNPTQIHVKLGNLNIGALGNLNIGQDARHGGRSGDGCFPTEAELALRAHFDLSPSAEDESAKTARKGFEKCTTTIQFNPETKNLFYNLQMPYGNHSSFFRHLILLEKYFRNGDLVISRHADPKAVNYISSVQNRIRSYEGGVSNPVPSKKPLDIPPSLSIVPQPVKTEGRNLHEIQPSVIQSRPFTLTPMPPPPNVTVHEYNKSTPLSHIQAAVQNLPSSSSSNHNDVYVGSLLKSMKSSVVHPKPEISITSLPPEPTPPPPPQPVRIGQNTATLTTKIQENLRNLASNSNVQSKQSSNQARAVILNRTVGGQKQSLVQVTTGGKTIHLTLYQFRRIQQMQLRKKQYLEHQARAMRSKEQENASGKSRMKTILPMPTPTPQQQGPDEGFDIKNLSPELEIQEIGPSSNGNELFPLISEVKSLAGEDSNNWEKSGSGETPAADAFPKLPRTLSVSVTKIPPDFNAAKEQSVESVD